MSTTANLWWHELPTLLDGLMVSMLLTGLGLAVALPMALAFALWTSATSRAVRWPGIVVVECGRGTPALITLQIAYFGLPQVHLTFTAMTAAVIGLGSVGASYMSEIIRAGLDAVPHGQREAARSMGMSTRDELRHVLLPQALRVATPPLLSFAIVMFQATSLAFSISVPELLSRAYQLGSTHFVFLQALTLAGILYAAVVVPAAIAVRRLEKRMAVV